MFSELRSFLRKCSEMFPDIFSAFVLCVTKIPQNSRQISHQISLRKNFKNSSTSFCSVYKHCAESKGVANGLVSVGISTPSRALRSQGLFQLGGGCDCNPHIQESPHPRAPKSPKSLKMDFPGLPHPGVQKSVEKVPAH